MLGKKAVNSYLQILSKKFSFSYCRKKMKSKQTAIVVICDHPSTIHPSIHLSIYLLFQPPMETEISFLY